MPLGWECKAKLVKQVPVKSTERSAPIVQETILPGPNHYEPPKIYCGNGFSKIKRAPAYSFGRVLKPSCAKSVSPNAPMFNVRGISEKGGGYKIPGGILTPHIESPSNKMNVPGPGAHKPDMKVQCKRLPAYSMRPAAKPPYQPFDSWTPPPNMYCPPIPKTRSPAFTFGYQDKTLPTARLPGPGEHNPNYNFVLKKKPAYSFGPRFRSRMQEETPSPNAYCDKMFMVNRRSIPAPSFGIRHSPFLGKEAVHLKPSDLDLRISQG